MAEGELRATPEERALHTRLLAGDAKAPRDLVVAHLPPLVESLRRQHPSVDPGLVESAADDALFELAMRPGVFDPSRGTLAGFLKVIAGRDLQNMLRAESRHAKRRASLEAVEVGRPVGNAEWDGTIDPLELIVRRSVADSELLQIVREQLDDAELTVFRLMFEGERPTKVYAEALGIEHLTDLEQALEVKRMKDRIRRRLQRHLQRPARHE